MLQKVQEELDALLQKELGTAQSSKLRSYAGLRLSYLRAVSKLRPTFFEDEEDFLELDKRVAEWEKRKRFNGLKKIWIRYDRIAPDKAHNLTLEDQEIENDLDMIEEEIQEEWSEFADELLHMLGDNDEDEEDYGDEEDFEDLEQWREEQKQMRQDASLLKRRILERTVQRRVKEEEAQREDEQSYKKKESKRKQRLVQTKASGDEIKLLRLVRTSQDDPGVGDEGADTRASRNKKTIRVHVKKYADMTAPKTPRVVRSSKSQDSPFNMSVPILDTDVDDLLKISPKAKVRRGSVGKTNTNEKPTTDNVSLLKKKFSCPTTPNGSERKNVGKTKSWTSYSVHSPRPTFPENLSQERRSRQSFHSPQLESTQRGDGVANKPSLGLRSIVKTLEVHAMVSPGELVNALTDLNELVKSNAASRQEFSRGRGNTCLADALQHYRKKDSDVCDACCQVIIPLVRYETNRDALALAGVIESIVVGMLHHRECTMLQVHGCDALRCFATVDKYKDWIVKSNVIQVLIKTQASFPLNDEVQSACLRCMAELAKNHRGHARSIAAAGGIKSLITAMNMTEYEGNIKVHSAALQAIAALAEDDDANRGAIANRDGIYMVLWAMESFADVSEMQQYGFEALCALSIDHAQNCRNISKQGGLPLILKIMKDHSTHEGVQEGALSLLRMMTEDNEVSAMVADSNGIDRVLQSMRRLESTTVHEQGCLVLCNLAIQDEEKDMIGNLGGITMIISSMKKLSASTLVQKSGCRALDSLATNDQSKVSIAASGGVSAIILSMQNHPTVAAIQAFAITALRKVATVARNRNIMKANNGIEVVEQAMRKYPKHKHLNENGQALVKLLDPTRSVFDPEACAESLGSAIADKEQAPSVPPAKNLHATKVLDTTKETEVKRRVKMSTRHASTTEVAARETKPGARGADAPGYKARKMGIK